MSTPDVVADPPVAGGCQDCSLCTDDAPAVAAAVLDDPHPRFDALCRFCVHALRRHSLAVARARLPGLRFALRPPPGSPLARLQAVLDAERRGLITAEEGVAARQRLFRRTHER